MKWIQASASAIHFDPSAFFITLTDHVFENPELAYRPLLHLEQLHNILVAYDKRQLELPAQLNEINSLDALLKITKIHPDIKDLDFADRGNIDPFALDSAKRLLISNFSPARIRATVGETFQQPGLEEINGVVHIVRDRVRLHRTTLMSMRGQLSEMVDDFRSDSAEFFDRKTQLASEYDLNSTIAPGSDFMNELEHAGLNIRKGKLRPLDSALQNHHTFVAKIRHEVALMNRCVNDLLLKRKQASPTPAHLETMRRIALKLHALTPHLDMLTRQWFSFELPDETDRYRFRAAFSNVAKVRPYRHTPTT